MKKSAPSQRRSAESPCTLAKVEKARERVRQTDPKKLPPHSLLRLPLLREAMCDRSFRIHPRAIDSGWSYAGIVEGSVNGFNPTLSSFFFAAKSSLGKWMTDPVHLSRELNFDDVLVKETMFMTHDYLHAWAYQIIKRGWPNLGIGLKPITRANLEEYAFVHLLTESVATVGLDYWLLSAQDLNDLVDVGSVSLPLTVSFRERDMAEYQRFNPALDVQNPEFFDFVARFYCSGIMTGFSSEDVKRSPKLYRWLKHEIMYGESQRRYTRLWLQHLTRQEIKFTEEELVGPVSIGKKWQNEMIKVVGDLLWKKIKKGETPKLPAYSQVNSWTSHHREALDFRFVNMNRISKGQANSLKERKFTAEGFTWFYNQFVSKFDFEKCPAEVRKILVCLKDSRDPELFFYLMKDQPQIPSLSPEPFDLMMFN